MVQSVVVDCTVVQQVQQVVVDHAVVQQDAVNHVVV